MLEYDFLIKGGRIIDPANKKDFIGDIAVKRNKIERVDEEINDTLAEQVINAKGKVIMPGIIDTHAHAYKKGVNGAGYRMLIKAGVTTVIDFQGPVESICQEITKYGCGINIATLQGIFPGMGITSKNAGKKEIKEAVNKALDHGALGMKIIGGHYPLTPETTYNIIHYTNRLQAYVGFHVGTTATGSNILGLEEAIKLAEGKPLHIAHVNAYCRGLIEDPLSELKRALTALCNSPNIVSESHLAPYNGCDGLIDRDGLPRSHVTRSCLEAEGYEINKKGLEKAMLDGYAGVYALVGSEMKYLFGKEAIKRWKEEGTAIGTCFPVNLRYSALVCALEKDQRGEFVIDAISSDGGAIPRNFILSYGVLLIKFGGLTFSEFVKKVAWTPSKMLGLENKGHLSPGADADIIVVNPENGDVEEVLSNGQVCMASGIVFNLPGKVLTTERGTNYLKQLDVPHEVVNLEKSLYINGKGGKNKPNLLSISVNN
jgi:hypothetical protein